MIELKPCPFCDGEPKVTFIGNDHTKKRSVEIKCTKCFTKQMTSTIRYNHAQCERWAVEKWNLRPAESHPVTEMVTDEIDSKNCSNCKFTDRGGFMEPCNSCRVNENWKPKQSEK